MDIVLAVDLAFAVIVILASALALKRLPSHSSQRFRHKINPRFKKP